MSGLIFNRPEWYDVGINWRARLDREIPVLREVFGPPAAGGILDAGCGTGRQAVALAKEGYRVTGADISKPAQASTGISFLNTIDKRRMIVSTTRRIFFVCIVHGHKLNL